MIIRMERGYIRLKIGDKTVTIYGEAYIPGSGSPDFVAYPKSIKAWDPPYENEKIEEATKTEIVEILKAEATKRNIKIEFE
ncbi:Imm74 family immunity protein [Pectinatus frisingensis]|uniref:Imm74 family immunity protein n=1 Tax=Pectinatus frisingensis TaxID=865 RepID=UPI003D8067ED